MKDHFGLVWNPTNPATKKIMLQEGLEPPTLGLLDPCSTKLSYQSSAGPPSGSNPGPSHIQSDAQPTELHGHIQYISLKMGAKWDQKGSPLKCMPKCSAVTQLTPMILLGAPRRVFFFPSQFKQSSVKLCYPYILNDVCQSGWFAFGVHAEVVKSQTKRSLGHQRLRPEVWDNQQCLTSNWWVVVYPLPYGRLMRFSFWLEHLASRKTALGRW